MTTKPAGMKTIEIPENASQAQFAAAYKTALKDFGSELNKQGAALGVFHDDEKHTIDIDPSTVVDNLPDAEAIGAASHAIGGAYCFADGDGYWPPHVADAAKPMVPLHKPLQGKAGGVHKPAVT